MTPPQPSLSSEHPQLKGWIHKSCTIVERLDGKLALVTGANCGIGLSIVAELARRGCRVIMACRNLERGRAAKELILSQYGSSRPDSVKVAVADVCVIPSLTTVESDLLILEKLDLASLDSVKDFANRVSENFSKLDFLINNAGVIAKDYATTVDGFEMTMGTNYLGPFLLTRLLLPLLERGAPSRVINVSSMGHYYGKICKPDLQLQKESYSSPRAYCHSKLTNVMHAIELNERMKGTGVMAVSLHPGTVQTELLRDMQDWKHVSLLLFNQFTGYVVVVTGSNSNNLTVQTSLDSKTILKAVLFPFLVNPWQGAQTVIYTVLTENLVPGGYYSNCKVAQPNRLVHDEVERRWFWKKSCELVGISQDAERND
ncbi:Retinol dehydrogenase 14 [Paragonimus heterotremus]|uniref:Retinol dehydrogenase 14 n=1 Tax=Paragonimus heterotremus TaxID=100268 RepID=A0A8J4T191_9TREM|nr:Retinol dehydrogenase 14 [Paragonimus heterotremus]